MPFAFVPRVGRRDINGRLAHPGYGHPPAQGGGERPGTTIGGYAYCYNNPVNLIDPLGLSAEENQVGVVQAEAESEQQG
ncbi:MAG: hypothetical protein R6V73_09985, partial [Anaerolineales bacterium]